MSCTKLEIIPGTEHGSQDILKIVPKLVCGPLTHTAQLGGIYGDAALERVDPRRSSMWSMHQPLNLKVEHSPEFKRPGKASAESP